MCHADNCGTGEGELICASADHISDPIRNHPAIQPRLREIATELKHLDGEHWVAGEIVERACNYLDACAAEAAAEVEGEAMAAQGREAAGAMDEFAAACEERQSDHS